MSPGEEPRLVGRHVDLRPFDAGQIHDRYVAWLNDPSVNEYSRRAGGRRIDAAEARRYLEGLGRDEVVLAIHHREHGHVGNVKYGPVDRDNRRADISILVGEPAVWSRGVGAEAVYLVTRHLFEEVGLNRVDAGSSNPAFLRMVRKLGWTVEGVLRQRIRTAEGYRDHTLVAQLAEEFERRPEFERAKADSACQVS